MIAVPNPHYPPTDDALKLAAATVDAIADLTTELVERVAGGRVTGERRVVAFARLAPSRTRTSALAGIATLLRRRCGHDGTVPRIPARGAVAHGTVLTRFRLARHSALDETRQRADPEGRLLPPRDDAEAGYAKDLVSFGRGNGDPPNRAPELRGKGDSPASPYIAAGLTR